MLSDLPSRVDRHMKRRSWLSEFLFADFDQVDFALFRSLSDLPDIGPSVRVMCNKSIYRKYNPGLYIFDVLSDYL